MQNYKQYFNPSTALMYPNENAILSAHNWYFSFVDDLLNIDQLNFVNSSYVIQGRLYSQDYINSFDLSSFINGLYSTNSLTYGWFSSAFNITKDNVFGNIITSTNKTLGGYQGRNQWRWGRTGDPVCDVTQTTDTTVDNYKYLFSSASFIKFQNYQFVYYYDTGSETLQYGYISKITPTTCLIYKYIDGAINMALPTDDANVFMTVATGVVGSYMFSNWVNYFYVGSLCNVLSFENTEINNVATTFKCNIEQHAFINIDWYRLTLYGDAEGKNMLYQSDRIYDQNLEVSVNGLNITRSDYYGNFEVSIKDTVKETGITDIPTNFPAFNVVSWGVSIKYHCGDDYLRILFPRWESYIVDNCNLYLFARDITDDIYTVLWEYSADSTENAVRYDYNVKNGHTYEYYIFRDNVSGSDDYMPLGTCTIDFDGFWIDDVENKTSYQLLKTLSGGDSTITNNMTENSQNFKYNSYNIGYSKYASGSITGQLVPDYSIESVDYVSSFRDLCMSNRETYFKNPKGYTYKVFIKDVSISPLAVDIDDQPQEVTLSWTQVE